VPETSERLSRDLRQWRVKERAFVWERPLRRADLDALGDEAPEGPILGARVEPAGSEGGVAGRRPDRLQELIVEAWLARAPTRLAKSYVDTSL
jgi:hypothetical protein